MLISPGEESISPGQTQSQRLLCFLITLSCPRRAITSPLAFSRLRRRSQNRLCVKWRCGPESTEFILRPGLRRGCDHHRYAAIRDACRNACLHRGREAFAPDSGGRASRSALSDSSETLVFRPKRSFSFSVTCRDVKGASVLLAPRRRARSRHLLI